MFVTLPIFGNSLALIEVSIKLFYELIGPGKVIDTL